MRYDSPEGGQVMLQMKDETQGVNSEKYSITWKQKQGKVLHLDSAAIGLDSSPIMRPNP